MFTFGKLLATGMRILANMHIVCLQFHTGGRITFEMVTGGQVLTEGHPFHHVFFQNCLQLVRFEAKTSHMEDFPNSICWNS
jgi:hypothetical protein